METPRCMTQLETTIDRNDGEIVAGEERGLLLVALILVGITVICMSDIVWA